MDIIWGLNTCYTKGEEQSNGEARKYLSLKLNIPGNSQIGSQLNKDSVVLVSFSFLNNQHKTQIFMEVWAWT